MSRDNIFHRVGKDENDVTEVLCNLMRDKYLRDILLKELKIPEDKIAKINFKDIETQGIIQDGKKPDIIIKNPTTLIYIENKIKDSELQESQYTTYLEDLNESRRKYRLMIYLIPKNYKDDYHNILKDTCNDNQELCKIVYWEDFIDKLSKYEIENSNPIFNESLAFFRDKLNIVENNFKFDIKDIIIMYNPEDLLAANSFFYKLITLFCDSDGIILKKLNAMNNVFTPSDWSGIFDKGNENEKGKFISYNKNQCIFYGLNFNILKWKEVRFIDSSDTLDLSLLPNFLLSVAIKKDVIIDENKLNDYKENKAVVCDNEWYYFKLGDKYMLAEDCVSDKFVESVVKIISDVLL